MTWGQLPLWLKIWFFTGLASFIAIIIPYGLKWPQVLIPAAIFGSSIAAMVIYGHLH